MARITITELQEKVSKLEMALRHADNVAKDIERERLSASREEAERHQKTVEELKRQIESEKNSYRWANERAAKAEAELDAAHSLVDAIDCPLSRKQKNEDGYGTTENALVLRIGAWLAKKAGMGAE